MWQTWDQVLRSKYKYKCQVLKVQVHEIGNPCPLCVDINIEIIVESSLVGWLKVECLQIRIEIITNERLLNEILNGLQEMTAALDSRIWR